MDHLLRIIFHVKEQYCIYYLIFCCFVDVTHLRCSNGFLLNLKCIEEDMINVLYKTLRDKYPCFIKSFM